MPLCRGLLRALTFLALGIFALVCLSHSRLFYPWDQCLVPVESAQEDMEMRVGGMNIDNKKYKVTMYETIW